MATGAFDDEPGRLIRREDALGNPGEEDSSSRGGRSWDWETGLLVVSVVVVVDVSGCHDDEGRSFGLVPGEESIVMGFAMPY